MTAYEKLKTVRAKDRPTGEVYINGLISERLDLCGDRRFGEDPAVIAGVGYLDKMPITYIAIDKGADLQDRVRKNFGCPKPEGYRKALRLMKQAEKFKMPILCIVDTLGAFCGTEGEQRGQGQAIAENIMEMMGLKTPVISIVTGEGGSGGALALAAANKVYMMENAVYSVITPDGCASILWKDSSRVAEAVDCLQITAEDMKRFGVAETVIPEDMKHFDRTCDVIKKQLLLDFGKLKGMSGEQIAEQRYRRFRDLGVYTEQ